MSQGYQIADEEIEMDLQTFRDRYANSAGFVECVTYNISSTYMLSDARLSV